MIGENIKRIRQLRGLSLPLLAEQAGISKTFLFQIESGKSLNPSAKILYQIAKALEVDIPELLGEPKIKAKKSEADFEITKALSAFINSMKERDIPLKEEEIDALARMKFRGKRPQTMEDYYFIYQYVISKRQKRQ